MFPKLTIYLIGKAINHFIAMGKILSDYEATYITTGLSFLLVLIWGH